MVTNTECIKYCLETEKVTNGGCREGHCICGQELKDFKKVKKNYKKENEVKKNYKKENEVKKTYKKENEVIKFEK